MASRCCTGRAGRCRGYLISSGSRSPRSRPAPPPLHPAAAPILTPLGTVADLATPPPDRDGSRVGEEIVVASDFVTCDRDHYRWVTKALRLAGADQRRRPDPGGLRPGAARLAPGSPRRRPRRLHKPQRLPATPTIRAAPIAPRASTRPTPRRRHRPRRHHYRVGRSRPGPEVATSPSMRCLVLGARVPSRRRRRGTGGRIAVGTVRTHLEEARHDLQAACDPT